MRVAIITSLALALCVSPLFNAAASPYVFTTFDAPGATSTSLVGINNTGTIVGNSTALGVQGGGFIYSDSMFSDLTAPAGAPVLAGLSAAGISNAGTVTGTFSLDTTMVYPGAKTVGFVQTSSSFQILDLNFFSTVPHGVNSAGSVVGEVNGPSPGSIGAFTFINGVRGYGPAQLTDLDFYPGIRDRGINDAGDIVGSYNSQSGLAGFVVKSGTTTKLSVPGASSTAAYGINNKGVVVGYYVSGTFNGYVYVDVAIHGFVEDMGSYLTIDVPGADATMAQAINDLGDVVGTYVDATGVSHGFLATPATDVPEPPSAILLGGGLIALLSLRRFHVI